MLPEQVGEGRFHSDLVVVIVEGGQQQICRLLQPSHDDLPFHLQFDWLGYVRGIGRVVLGHVLGSEREELGKPRGEAHPLGDAGQGECLDVEAAHARFAVLDIPALRKSDDAGTRHPERLRVRSEQLRVTNRVGGVPRATAMEVRDPQPARGPLQRDDQVDAWVRPVPELRAEPQHDGALREPGLEVGVVALHRLPDQFADVFYDPGRSRVLPIRTKLLPHTPIEDDAAVGVGVCVGSPVSDRASVVDPYHALEGAGGVERCLPALPNLLQRRGRRRNFAAEPVKNLGGMRHQTTPLGFGLLRIWSFS